MRNTATMTRTPKELLKDAPLFSSFAVKDVEAAKEFYGRTLGIAIRDGREPGTLEIHGKESTPVFIYPKPDHQPAVFTVLNPGVKMEHYKDMAGITTDAKGIARGAGDRDGTQGPSIAWFRDPSGNILSVLESR
jgi:predicted enzyme related to lactoylglutathione lyase